MKKKLIILGIIIFVSGLALVGVAKTDKLSVSGFSNPFQNIQAQPLTDDGTTTYFTDQTSDFAVGGTGSGAALWFDESAGDLTIDGTFTPSGLSTFAGFISTASSTIDANLNITGNSTSTNATTTGSFYIGGDLRVVGSGQFDSNVGFGTTTPQMKVQAVGLMGIYPDGTGTTTCSSLIEGALMYATGTQGFYFCNGSAWTAF